MFKKHSKSVRSQLTECGPCLLRKLLLRLLELALQLQQRAVLELRRAVQVVVALRRLQRTQTPGELKPALFMQLPAKAKGTWISMSKSISVSQLHCALSGGHQGIRRQGNMRSAACAAGQRNSKCTNEPPSPRPNSLTHR